MERAAVCIILILILPAPGHGGTKAVLRLDHAGREPVPCERHNLPLPGKSKDGTFLTGRLELPSLEEIGIRNGGNIDQINGGLPYARPSAPRDMISMVSFVWARMFGGVDIVAEARDFARRVRQKSRPRPGARGKDHHWGNRWQLMVACRIDDVTEVAASFENHGTFFRDGNVSLKINALDPTSGEIGLTMAYSGGDLNIRADRLTLTDTAEARLVMKF